MPMIDAVIPEGALTPAAEAVLIREVTDILLAHEEGLDPGNARAQAVSVLFLHRPQVFVAGAPADAPRYRFIPQVPDGQYGDGARFASLVRQITEAVARAEAAPFDAVSPRVWVFPAEIADGRWGARGVVRRLPDIVGYLLGEAAAPAAAARLENLQRQRALTLLRQALGPAES